MLPSQPSFHFAYGSGAEEPHAMPCEMHRLRCAPLCMTERKLAILGNTSSGQVHNSPGHAPKRPKEMAAARCQQASPRRHKPTPRVAHGATNPLGIALRRSTEQPKCFSCSAHPLFFIKVIWSGTVVFNKPCTVLLTPVAAFAGLWCSRRAPRAQ